MKVLIDHKILKKITHEDAESNTKSLLEVCQQCGFLQEGQPLQIQLDWSSLLELIGFGSILEAISLFDDKDPLFSFLITNLESNVERDLVIRLYDQVFIDSLTQIKSLPQMDPSFLKEQIQKKRQSSSSDLFSSSLEYYEKLLTEHPYDAIHNLTLFLAWDLVCVNFALVFEHIFSDPKSPKGLVTLLECLLESFQHIREQGRTSPVFFRMCEALYAFLMRDEFLQSYSEAEWLVLCQGSQALRPRDKLPDAGYIDASVINVQELKNADTILTAFTLDSIERVQVGLSLAGIMMERLKRENPDWPYAIRPVHIICLKENNEGFGLNIN